MADFRTTLSVFSAEDNIDIEIVKKLIPIAPSDYWRKGDPVKANQKLLRKESCWEMEFYKKTVDIEGCIEVLSIFIDNHKEALKKLHFDNNFRILILFVITIHSFNSPIIEMKPEFIKKLSDIGGEFQIALYYDDEEDDSPDAYTGEEDGSFRIIK